MKRHLLRGLLSLALMIVATNFAVAAIPSGYYSNCVGKTKDNLLTALYQQISSHTTISYKSGLPDLYKTSDVRANGKIWDMYSTSAFSPTGDACGSYSYVGDCWNREHSFPKSWFDDASPMYSDAFHIYPTDGKVNGQRSNYPYGECSAGTTLPSHNGVDALGKLGKCTFPGYSGTVFEPDDEYKGDFARSYFYMAACYNNRIASWKSDMLAGNAYPAFSSWAINLLLKWHRQDPVSQKEINRNEVVYGKQKNRNPFIDHPELAEYIWGNRMGMAWDESAGTDPIIASPVDGSTIDFGTTGINIERTRTITVKGASLESNVSVAISGTGFSASATSLTKESVSSTDGASLTLTYQSAVKADAKGTLTLTSGSLTTKVNLTATALDGLPAGPAQQISDRSFVATWTNIDAPNTLYTITVYQGGIALDGYPVTVRAEAEKDLIEDLIPDTDYTYIVASPTMTSNVVSVHTADPIPLIEMKSESELDEFYSTPGTPGIPVIINIENENIFEDITISVEAPFEVSTDKATWARTMKISPEEEQFFVRINSEVEGVFTSRLSAEITGYKAETLTLEGKVGQKIDFYEDFEANAAGFGNYTNTDPYYGNGCAWQFSNAGIYDKEGCLDEFENATQAIRFGKNANSSATMLEDLTSGVGKIKFFAHKWTTDNDAEIELDYSTDSGNTWNKAYTTTISSTTYQEYTASVNIAGKVRLRFLQTSGSRWLLDNISAESYSSVEGINADKNWVAYSRDHKLVIENAPKARVEVYTTDGRTLLSTKIKGDYTVELPANLYIVVINNTAKRVVVK